MENGKCYGIVGNNGCGKTMLLRAICGYMDIDDGKITLDGKVIGKDIDFIKNAGIIIGETQFINSLSGFDNLKILAEIQNKIGDESKKIFIGNETKTQAGSGFHGKSRNFNS